MSVYELSNEALKEFYLCASVSELKELMRAHCERPPAPIAHWKKDHGVFYSEVEKFADEKLAGDFLTIYTVTLERTGWKVIR